MSGQSTQWCSVSVGVTGSGKWKEGPWPCNEDSVPREGKSASVSGVNGFAEDHSEMLILFLNSTT